VPETFGHAQGEENVTRPVDGDATPCGLSRRELFKGASGLGAAATATAFVAAPDLALAQAARAPARPVRREALETLTAEELDTLEAIVARLIPSDARGPGAKEARAAHFIDKSLAGPTATNRQAYANGLAAIDVYAEEKKGAPFASLRPADQDAILTDMEKNVATGFKPSAASFFNLVRADTIQGTFSDPYHGGNADYVGWDMIGYPGIRMVVEESDQRLAKPATVRASAYDDDTFVKHGGGHGR
jgi:gluconate 2-dehydrogenase gamma chain